MTRINVGIPPSELNDKHLIAEAREIKRVPNCVAKGRYNLKSQPKEFTHPPVVNESPPTEYSSFNHPKTKGK